MVLEQRLKLAAGAAEDSAEKHNVPVTAAPWRCAPCNKGRLEASPLLSVLVLLLGGNYVVSVVFLLTSDQQASGISTAVLVVFHVPLLLACASWLATCSTDPGGADVEWYQKAEACNSDSVVDYKSGADLFSHHR